MMDNIEKLGKMFSEIVDNYNAYASSWKSIPVAEEAFRLMRDDLPLRVKGELTPYTRIVLLDEMMDCLPERCCSRFLLSVKQYQLSMFPLIEDGDINEDMDVDHYKGDPAQYVHAVKINDIKKSLKRTEDYLDMSVPMETWCKDYGVSLKFDPVERTGNWEKVIYDVELECEEILKDERKGMGFCYEYWSTKAAALARRGIDWRSPAVMNPRVKFD